MNLSMTELIAQLEQVGFRYMWGNASWTFDDSDVVDTSQTQTLRNYAAAHWDAFEAAIEVHLRQRDGTL